MSKKVLIVTSSLRKNSNSDALAEAFAKGAESAGNEVEILSLKGRDIAYCKGCLACQRTKKCVMSDDAAEFTEKVKNADVLAFASPIYYYSLSGQLKTLLDRLNPLFSADCAFGDVYLLLTAADDTPGTEEGAVKCMQGWIDCFDNARLAGIVFCGGVNAPGDIAGAPALKEAFEKGKNA